MAPRKKRTTTKKGRSSARAKPKLPEGKLDSSMTFEEKENKVDDYVKDYELQVKTRLDKMRKWAATVTNLIGNIYRNALIQIPKSVRQMTMKEFLSKGGTVNAALNAQATENIQDLVSNSMPSVNSTNERLPLSNMSNKIDVTGSHMEEISHAEAESNVKTAGKTVRKRKVRIAEETPALSSHKRKPVITGTRSSRRLQSKSSTQGVTPMSTISNQSVVQTPFITPKFDPRLPFTPAILREPKAGERIVSMYGSPLSNPAGPTCMKDVQVFIPLKGGKTMQLSSNDQSTTINELDVMNDTVALQNIRLLQDKLTRILQMPKNQ